VPKRKQIEARFVVDPDAAEAEEVGLDGENSNQQVLVEEEPIKKDVFCARCFSIRNYGKVKNPEIEDQLPSFDVASKLCSRIANIKGIRQVLLCVVDITDFDGSIPTETLSRLFSDPQIAQKNISFIFALNKVDLLPRVASDQRLQAWTRRQISSLNLPEDVSVKLVSAVAGKGIADLAGTLQSKVGQYGHLWVFGAQNAGKSSLINALRRHANGEKPAASRNSRNNGISKSKIRQEHTQTQQLTEASLPGTTIGFVRLDNVLPNRCKAFDTPGILHKYQFTSTYSPLSYEEIGMLLPRRKLKPRTFRCMVGYSVSIGGLARVDLVGAPGNSIYLTLWASDEVTHHFGKTENAEKKQSQAVGQVLYPPTSKEAMPHLVPSEFLVNGNNWKKSSEDVAIAGLGWVAVGVAGECSLRVWSPKSVLVYQREALMPDYAENFERPGYGQMLPKSKK
jgi:ribosome biogenesis GTPase A